MKNNRFCNIRTVRGSNYSGYQVTITIGGEVDGTFFSGLNRKSLRSALERRNKIYRAFHVMPNNIARRKLETPTVDHRLGISEVLITERNGETCHAFQCRLRNLRSGNQTHKSIRFHLHGGRNKSLRMAVAVTKANIEAYNVMTERFNELCLPCVFALASEEVKRMVPKLARFRRLCRRAIWNRVYREFYPMGLESNLDVRN